MTGKNGDWGGPSRDAQLDSPLRWAVDLGLPALGIGVGLAIATTITGTTSFCLGMGIASVAWVGLLIQIIRAENEASTLENLIRLCIWGLMGYVILWIIIRPDPMSVVIRRGPGNYSTNYDVGSIKWSDKFSETDIHLQNDSNSTYTNLDITIISDLIIYQVSINSPLSDCKQSTMGAMSSMTLELHFKDNDGQDHTARSPPPFASRKFRLHCDSLPSKSFIDLILALVKINTRPERSPDMLLPHSDPKWVVTQVEFQSNGRSRTIDMAKCFDGDDKCPDMMTDNGDSGSLGIGTLKIP
jgi:hypothetical protein